MRQGLAYLRASNKLTKGTIDGWALMHVALAAVRELDADSWIYSFDKVNLKPSTRVSFAEWTKRIEHYIQGSESFKSEIVRDPYALLSPFWHGMAPDEKKLAISIFQSVREHVQRLVHQGAHRQGARFAGRDAEFARRHRARDSEPVPPRARQA